MNKIGLIISIALALNLNLALAYNAPGYIVTNNADTLFGDVKVLGFDVYTGGFLFSGINLEQFHSALKFRENCRSTFKVFTANDIAGFGFVYKSTNYSFKTFLIESASIVKSERKRLRFLNLIHQGEIALYRDIVRKNNYFITNTPNSKVIDYSDYYLIDDKHGLKKVIGANEYKSLIEIFLYYEINQKFLEQLPATIRFKDINDILYTYETWQSNNADEVLKINLK